METGSNYPAVNERDVRALKLFVPHSTERARIAAVLDAADHEIERTQALIEKLKQIRTGLLRDLLTRGLDEKGELRDPILCPEQFRNSPLGRIPRQWKIARIDDAIERPGDLAIGPFGSNLLASDYRENGAPVVFVRDVREDEFFWKSCVYIDQDKAAELSAHSVCPGDLLITKMGLPPCTAAVYPEGMPEGVITADVIRLRARVSLVMSHWLSAYINSAIFAACVRRITGGVTRPKVTLTDFREQPVLLPPLAEQQRIETVLQAMSTEITEAKAESDKLKLLKSGLMSDLLTGRVQIPSIFLETTA
jgi:type I restriction enzyme S subunit